MQAPRVRLHIPGSAHRHDQQQRVAKRASAGGLVQVRVHDLKHTFGRRLRAAGVPLETRKVLLGHRNGDITTHYSAPELEELIEATGRVCYRDFGKTSAPTSLKRKAVVALGDNRLM